MGVSSYNDIEFGHSSVSEDCIYHAGILFVTSVNEHPVTIAFHKGSVSLAHIDIVN